MNQIETLPQSGDIQNEVLTAESLFEGELDHMAKDVSAITFLSGNWDHSFYALTGSEFGPRDAFARVYDQYQPYFELEDGSHDILAPKDPIGTLHRVSKFIYETVSALKMSPKPDFVTKLFDMQYEREYEYTETTTIRTIKYPGINSMVDCRWFVDGDKQHAWQEQYVYPSEYLIYRSLAEDRELLHTLPEITENLLGAIRTNPEHAFALLYALGADTLFPHFPIFVYNFLDRFMDRLHEWESVKDDQDGIDFFVEALTKHGLVINNKGDDESNEAYARRIFQCIPHLDPYTRYDLKRYERQSDEFYMQIALASAEFSARSGRGPFGAVIVNPYGQFIMATNEIDPVTDQTIHAETALMRKAYKFWGKRSTKDCTAYSTAEPCFGCAKEILHGNSVSQVVYGVPTTMGMDYFGITQAEHLKKLECGMPDMKGGVLEQQIREFYQEKHYINLIRPSKIGVSTIQSK